MRFLQPWGDVGEFMVEPAHPTPETLSPLFPEEAVTS